MTCPICKGEGRVIYHYGPLERTAKCPHCRDWGFWRRLWEKVKGVFGA